MSLQGQMINRYGTTTANFLEIGVGSDGSAMGEAFVAVTDGISSIYWNPAGLAHLERSSAAFMVHPWIVDINMLFTGGAFIVPGFGNIGFGITQMDYGDMPVTTLEYQEGTGENFTASDLDCQTQKDKVIWQLSSCLLVTKHIQITSMHALNYSMQQCLHSRTFQV